MQIVFRRDIKTKKTDAERIERMKTNKSENTIGRQKIRQRICLTAAILWMVLIFFFSARPADVSTKDSNGIGLLIGELCIPDFSEWTEEERLGFAQKIDHPVRKTAHAAEYAVLGMFLVGSFMGDRKGYKKEQKLGKTAALSWGTGTLYAASDEFHQLFVSGRSGQISDVMLDSTGVLVGVGIAVGWIWIISKMKQNDHRIRSMTET